MQNFHDFVTVVGTFAMTMVTMMTTMLVILKTLSKVAIDKKTLLMGELNCEQKK